MSIFVVGWPYCGEIDIMEMVGGTGLKDRTTHGTAHWYDGGHQYLGSAKTLSEPLSAGYHVYTVIWRSASIRWLVDGQEFYSLPVTNEMQEFRSPRSSC